MAGVRAGLRHLLAALPAPLRLGRDQARAEETVPRPHRRPARLARLFVQPHLRHRPGGMLGDLFGPRFLLSFLILLWSGCVALLAAGTGFWSLAWVRALFGLTQAGAYPILAQVTRTWFPPGVRTTVQGLVGTLAG